VRHSAFACRFGPSPDVARRRVLHGRATLVRPEAAVVGAPPVKRREVCARHVAGHSFGSATAFEIVISGAANGRSRSGCPRSTTHVSPSAGRNVW
jgi:hypothetical protein